MTVSIAALVFSMVAWINGTGMLEPAWPDAELTINVASHEDMAHDINRCQVLEGHDPIPHEDLMAFVPDINGIYCHDRITIYEKLDMNRLEDQYVLVHELVHWLQDYNGEAEEADCIGELERTAYAVHGYWQDVQGLPRTHDPFTIMMRSQCGPPPA